MKAVIMAGGEGTRLRPQTSNLPKPMLPLVGRPMMEHIVSLLRRHGITDIVVTVAFMPNAIRSYFGDGSELGVRMVYATEETPLGTAGSVRNAKEELTERFLVISGDVLTDIDLTVDDRVPREESGAGHDRAVRGREPARVRHRHHPGGRQHRALLGEAGLGPGLQRHHQHRHLRARARDLRRHPRGPLRRLLERGLPGRARGRATRSSATWPTATGRTWAPRPPTSRPTRTSSTARSRSTSPASSCGPGVWLGKGSSVDPTAAIVGPAFIGENCTIDAGVDTRRLQHHRGQHPGGRAGRVCGTRSSARTPTSGRRSAWRARCSAGPATCAGAPAASRARSWARAASSGPRPRSAAT